MASYSACQTFVEEPLLTHLFALLSRLQQRQATPIGMMWPTSRLQPHRNMCRLSTSLKAQSQAPSEYKAECPCYPVPKHVCSLLQPMMQAALVTLVPIHEGSLTEA